MVSRSTLRGTGGQGVEVEAGDVGVELVLDDHPLGVASEEVLAAVVRPLVISRVGWSWPMLRMAIGGRWLMPLRWTISSWIWGWR